MSGGGASGEPREHGIADLCSAAVMHGGVASLYGEDVPGGRGIGQRRSGVVSDGTYGGER